MRLCQRPETRDTAPDLATLHTVRLSTTEAGHKLIKIRATGFLAHHLQAEAFHPWAEMKSEDYNDKYLKAMERIVDCIVEVAQRLQGEEQRNSYRQAVHFQLQYTIASANSVRHIVDNDVVPRGEIALQRCLHLCKLTDDPLLTKDVIARYKIHVENLCGEWEPNPETMRIFREVIGRGKQ